MKPVVDSVIELQPKAINCKVVDSQPGLVAETQPSDVGCCHSMCECSSECLECVIECVRSLGGD
ncbi:hypothetical protein DPMN_030811 [Dreissena polymorpha]|uniref:Uncharacterized protein n=1 Tax=Dreissena polymorpha TaxID=45954 RepID=A0A9D4M121_DREPO|nr:hypothetical protein DPMN_030811 [Dreissena polymorpha]